MTDNPLNLEGRRVLVTGASSGIGRAASERLAQQGAQLICLGRDATRLSATLAGLAGQNHQARQADLNDADAIVSLVSELVSEFGPLAGIVHSAGMQRANPLRMAKPDDFLDPFRTNTLSAAMLLGAIARRGIAAPEGCSVVLVGSVMSVLGAAGLSGYCASKAALAGLVRAAALELASARVRVNAVLPGVVDTEMSRKHLESLGEAQTAAIRQMHPLGFGRPEDVAHAIAFLVADTSRWITGSCLVVDGGYSAH